MRRLGCQMRTLTSRAFRGFVFAYRNAALIPKLKAQRGQGMVELVVCASAFLLLLLGGIQLAVVLNAALAVSQYAYAGARYASVHGSGQAFSSYGSTIAGNVPASATIQGAGLGTPTVTCTGCTGGNIVSGAQLTVSVTYNLTTGHKIGVPNPFFGYTFPTSITNTTSMMAE